MAKRPPATLVYQLHIRLIDSKPDMLAQNIGARAF